MSKILVIFVVILFLVFVADAQSPGVIVRPAGGPYSINLDPNQNGFSSATTSGFISNDISESEIQYIIVPPAVTEPTGDLATGPSGGFTDIVKTVDGSGFYVYSNGTNIHFRLRIGGIISGSKGYSILIDTDGKMGNSGPNADPNYVAPTNTSNGNPGFEYEVVFQTNFNVAVFNVNGTTNPGAPVVTYSLATNSQISVALSTDGNNPDYFYDWFVPLSAIGNPTSIRMAATTVTSPSSALQGSRSDIYGIDDRNSSPSDAWTSVVNSQPPIPVTVSGISTVNTVCTAPPTINSPINTGSNMLITGTWTRMDATKPSTATITLFKNGVALILTASVSSGATWSISVSTVAIGDVFYAKAQATGESMCLQSANVTAGCTTVINPSVLTQSSSKGICGSLTSGATTALIYLINGTTTTLLNAGNSNTTYTATTFTYFACSGGSGNLSNGTYMIILSGNGCNSAPAFTCIRTGSSAVEPLATNAISLTTPVYPFHTTINGTGTAVGDVLKLSVNNVFISTLTATGTSFSFSGLTLNQNDQIKIYSQSGTGCLTVSNTFTVGCYTQPPLINTNSAGNLLAGATTISGTSSAIGATVTVRVGASPTGTSVGTAVVNSSGVWSLITTALVAGNSYYTTQTINGCTSPSSAAASVVSVTTACASFGSTGYASSAASISGTINSTFSGTVRVFLDGSQIGSTAVSSATTWTINSPYTLPLYPGGILAVTAQSGTSAQNGGCNTAMVTCTSPAVPSITPNNITITEGGSVSFNITNVVADTWYSLFDDNGTSYGTTSYRTTTNSFSLATSIFFNTGTYNLKINADKLSGCPASFAAATIIVEPSVLAVKFLDVSIQKNNNGNLVSWSVANEQNVNHYEIQRSSDCNSFDSIGVQNYVPSNAYINNYSFIDRAGQDGKLCYRIKEVDANGKISYSKIVSVQNISATTRLFPIPAKESLMIKYNIQVPELVQLKLVDLSGKIIWQKTQRTAEGINYTEIKDLHLFNTGMYFLHISSLSKSEAHKVIIER
ncbi:MAG: T9SS type A sorting domain-containing protein [Chitinophagaceae bacterium]|nr:T9SS type A sorting domain-containing protein [Chitinophagaceae bacterium]